MCKMKVLVITQREGRYDLYNATSGAPWVACTVADGESEPKKTPTEVREELHKAVEEFFT